MQVLEQPSPLVVLPSSHCSVPTICPSPHFGTQGLPGMRHCQPGSMVLQSPEQPSPLTVLPSSQASWLDNFPSPQTARETQGWPGVGQLHSFGFSSWHVFEQPSPPTLLPSSHCSLVSMIPSPQLLSNCCTISVVVTDVDVGFTTKPPPLLVAPVLPAPPLFPELPLPCPPLVLPGGRLATSLAEQPAES